MNPGSQTVAGARRQRQTVYRRNRTGTVERTAVVGIEPSGTRTGLALSIDAAGRVSSPQG
jgi:hypothetical protein